MEPEFSDHQNFQLPLPFSSKHTIIRPIAGKRKCRIWKLLIDKKMNKKDLRLAAGVSTSAVP
jgi:hypothetical protein